MQEVKDEIIERAKHSTIRSLAQLALSHLFQFASDILRRYTNRQQHLPYRCGYSLGQAANVFGRNNDGQKCSLRNADHQLFRARENDVGIPVPKHGRRRRGRTKILWRASGEQFLGTADGEHAAVGLCGLTLELSRVP